MGISCQHVHEHLIAYVNGETGPRLRRRIAEHLHTCDSCYADYVRERDTARDAQNDLTLLGRPESTQLDRIWEAVHVELDTMPAQPQQPQTYGVRRSLALVTLMVLCVLPWSASVEDRVIAALDLRATPAVMPYGTPDSTTTSVASIAVYNHDGRPTEDVLPPTATSTPAVVPVPGQ
ncbi:MAG: zf-HC2 domain-containing protein [Chloroflexota bacterium]